MPDIITQCLAKAERDGEGCREGRFLNAEIGAGRVPGGGEGFEHRVLSWEGAVRGASQKEAGSRSDRGLFGLCAFEHLAPRRHHALLVRARSLHKPNNGRHYPFASLPRARSCEDLLQSTRCAWSLDLTQQAKPQTRVRRSGLARHAPRRRTGVKQMAVLEVWEVWEVWDVLEVLEVLEIWKVLPAGACLRRHPSHLRGRVSAAFRLL